MGAVMLVAGLVVPGAVAAQTTGAPRAETVWIPFIEKTLLGPNRERALEATLFARPASGTAPLLVFNHGSTGRGRSVPTTTVTYPATARFFADRGFAVLIPMRRGRGASDGEYLERYECHGPTLAAGVDRAIADLDTVMAFVARQPWVDRSRLLLGGMSRGGLLSIVYPSVRTTPFRGVINLAGGWTAEGCDARINFNGSTLGAAGRTARLPMLWLYAENDRNYGPAAIRAYHEAFTRAGGVADLKLLPPIGDNGHILLPRHPEVWGHAVDAFLARLGLPGR
jgi:dienelactone hydrolase